VVAIGCRLHGSNPTSFSACIAERSVRIDQLTRLFSITRGILNYFEKFTVISTKFVARVLVVLRSDSGRNVVWKKFPPLTSKKLTYLIPYLLLLRCTTLCFLTLCLRRFGWYFSGRNNVANVRLGRKLELMMKQKLTLWITCTILRLILKILRTEL
jgi:hypothetical protein